MLKSKVNKLFLTYILTFSSLIIAGSEKPTYQVEQQNWNTCNEILIETPRSKAETTNNKMLNVFSSLALGSVFWLNLSVHLGALSTTKYEVTITPASSTPIISLRRGLFYNKFKLLLTALPSLYVTRYAFKKMHEWFLAKEEQKALRAYIENWEANKSTTPAKLQDLLNNTYLKYKENPKQVDFAETARIVKAFFNVQKTKEAKTSNVQVKR